MNSRKNLFFALVLMALLFALPGSIQAAEETAAPTAPIVVSDPQPEAALPAVDSGQATPAATTAANETDGGTIPETSPSSNEQALSADTQSEVNSPATPEANTDASDKSDASAHTDGTVPTHGATTEKAQVNENNASNIEPMPLETGATESPANAPVTVQSLLNDSAPQLSETSNATRTQIEVYDFNELLEAVRNAGTTPTTILIKGAVRFTETLNITAGQDILLTMGKSTTPSNGSASGNTSTTPATGSCDEKAETNKATVTDMREKGELALEATDLSKHPLEKPDFVLTRDPLMDLTKGMIKVWRNALLTLGQDADDALYIDAGGDNGQGIVTEVYLGGTIVQVEGELQMNGGTLTNSYNKKGYSAPINVYSNGLFVMNGGRISQNTIRPDSTQMPNAAGGVWVNSNAKMVMNGGSIDNNTGFTGGVCLGSLYGNSNNPSGKPAEFIFNEGIITRNRASDSYVSMGGGILVHSGARLQQNGGIIAGNQAPIGGGVAVNDGYVNGYDGVSYSNTTKQAYDEYRKTMGAAYVMDGGLLYKNWASVTYNPNHSGAGGGIYVSSNDVSLNQGFLLDNTADNMGGGVYVSIIPYTLTLKNALITENKAFSSASIYQYSGGAGGGYWNCPIGNVNLEDGNSVYVFDNNASSAGDDVYLHGKNPYYRLNGETIGGTFLSTVSPITAGHNLILWYEDNAGNRYDPNDPRVAEWLRNSNNGFSLKAIYSDAARLEAWCNSRLFILGNSAQKGGGIGSNANIDFPGKPGDYEIAVKKVWDSATHAENKPKSIWVDLFLGDAKYDRVLLNAANKWSALFKKIGMSKAEADQLGLTFSVREEPLDGFVSKVDVLVRENETQTTPPALVIERKWSDLIYVDPYRYDDPSNFRYWYPEWARDPAVTLTFKYNGEVIGSAFMDEESDWKAVFAHQLFTGTTIPLKTAYYGEDAFYEEGTPGLSNHESAYDVFIEGDAENGFTIRLPYLWLNGPANTVDPETSGFFPSLREGKTTTLDDLHLFTVTNYPYVDIPVEKLWDSSVGVDARPESVKIYLLRNGQRVKDDTGEDIFIELNAAGDWKGVFKHLTPYALEPDGGYRYELEEVSEQFIPVYDKKTAKVKLEVLRSSDYYSGDNVYANYPSYTFPDIELTMNLFINGTQIDSAITRIFRDGRDSEAAVLMLPLEIHDRLLDIVYVPMENGLPYSNSLLAYDLHVKGDAQKGYTLYVPILRNHADALNVKAIYDGSFALTAENFHRPTHEINVEKTWNTGGRPDRIPANLKVIVTRAGKAIGQLLLDADGNWTGQIINLPTGDGQNGYVYAVEEESLKSFKASQLLTQALRLQGPSDTTAPQTLLVQLPDGTTATITADATGAYVVDGDALNAILKGGRFIYAVEKQDPDLGYRLRIETLPDGSYRIIYPSAMRLTETSLVHFTNTYQPPTPPTPSEPPEEPEKPPVPPVIPEVPAKPPVPPVIPEVPAKPPVPPVIPEVPAKPPVPPVTPEKPLVPPITPEKPTLTPPSPNQPQGTKIIPQTGQSDSPWLPLVLLLAGGLLLSWRRRHTA